MEQNDRPLRVIDSKTGSDSVGHVIIIYDSLCGWCYGAKPVFDTLTRKLPAGWTLEFIHRALFTDDNRRPLGDGFGRHIWEADRRIQALTGQAFSSKYYQQILGDPDAILDSYWTALAAQIVKKYKPSAEMLLLDYLQRARFIEGRDLSDESGVRYLLAAMGLIAEQRELTEPATIKLMRAAQQRALELLNDVEFYGIPAVIVERRGVTRRLPHTFYLDRPEFAGELYKNVSEHSVLQKQTLASSF